MEALNNNLVLNEFASLAGAGVTFDFSADYSITPNAAAFTPASDEVIAVSELSLIITTATAVDNSGEFGDVAALSAGSYLRVVDGVLATVQSVAPEIKTNADLFAIGSLDINSDLTAGGFVTKATVKLPSPVLVDGALSHSVIFSLADDFSGLTELKVLVKGYYINKYQNA